MSRSSREDMMGMTEGEVHSLIELSVAGSGLSPELKKSRGGFLWWYADLVDREGNGLVLIWSYGLPFLPGYASAARRGEAPEAGARPSLNVSTYRKGVLDFYLLQEFDPREVSWEATEAGDRWSFGASTLSSLVVEGERRLVVDLNLDVPGMNAPVRLSLKGKGPAVAVTPGEHRPELRQAAPLPAHDWTPILCATVGEAVFESGSERVEMQGRLYHDRNGGKLPLHDLGIDIWAWGRVSMPGRDFIYYVLDGSAGKDEALFLEICDQGVLKRIEGCELRRGKMQKNLGGLRWWQTMEIWREGEVFLSLHHRDVVDSGPFYLRSLFEARCSAGEVHRGVAEVCDPARVDLAVHRPLVKMRVHDRRSLNSMWLPLFTGPKQGRVERLVRSWTKAPASLLAGRQG